MNTLGSFTPLRRLALASGMSRRELAAKAGLSRQTLYNIERDGTASDETIFKLAGALGMNAVDVAEALFGAKEMAA